MTKPTDTAPDALDLFLASIGFAGHSPENSVAVKAGLTDEEIAAMLLDDASDAAATGDDGSDDDLPDPVNAAGLYLHRYLRAGRDEHEIAYRTALAADPWALGREVYDAMALDALTPDDGRCPAIDIVHVVTAVRTAKRLVAEVDAGKHRRA